MIEIDLNAMSKQNGKTEVECAKLITEVLQARSQEWNEKITLAFALKQGK
ncbi:MAG: hypothetical protein WC560_10090 [Syntrophales bacterium]